MCHKCNQPTNNCGCSQTTVQHNVCHQCPPQVCDCPVKLDADCSTYTGDDIVCGETTVVPKNTILSDALNLIITWICGKFDELANYLRLINVGLGAKIYAGDNLLGEKKLRTLTTSSSILTITENTDEIEFGVDTDEMNDFVNISNVGTGAQAYKGFNSGTSTHEFRTVIDTPQGTGIELINVTQLTDEIDIQHKTLVTNTLDIIPELDGSVSINLLTDANIKQFYVNENYTGVETGSILKPYKKLTSALVAAIGSGTITDPEFEGANIILQTNVIVAQADLTSNPVLQDKLSVNTITIKSENGDNKKITFEGITDYPIDTEFLFNQVGVDGNLDLNRSILLRFDGIEIESETVKGLIRSKSYNSGVVDITKPNSELYYINGVVSANYKPSGAYVLAKDSGNNNITHFGANVYVQDSIINNTPHILAYGRGVNGEGSFFCDGIKIVGTSQTHFKLLNTSFTSENLEICTNPFMVPTDDVSPTSLGVYLPKTDVYKLHVENSYCRIFRFEDNSDQANNQVDGGVYVGGLNSYFRCTNPGLFTNANFKIDSGFIYDGYSNYLLETDKDYGAKELVKCDFSSLSTRLSAFNYIGTISGNKNVNIEGSEIKNIESVSVTNIAVSAASAVVNNFPFTSVATFANNADALAGGLIPGNIYYNTTTNIATRVV